MIVRTAKRPTWVQVDNRTVEDSALSFKALGLLVYLLSKPPNWRVETRQLVGSHGDGDYAVRSALAELEEHGYLVRRWEQDETGVPRPVGVVYERPGDAEIAAETVPSDSRYSRIAETAPIIKTDSLLTTEASPDGDAGAPAAKTLDALFAEFWAAYPIKRGRKPAVRAFTSALKRANPSTIIEGARRYAEDPNRDPTHTKWAQGWLNDDRWEDAPLPARSNGNGRRPSPPVEPPITARRDYEIMEDL